MGHKPTYGALADLTAEALLSGANRLTKSHFEWDISGGCESPPTFELTARPALRDNPALAGLPVDTKRALMSLGLVHAMNVRGYRYENGDNYPLWLSLTVRCRKCPWCLKMRAIEWANKAKEEISRAPRTWFATLTLTPDEHFRVQGLAGLRQADSDKPFEALPEIEQFRLRCAVLSPDITRYIKRVRKQSGSRIRYLLVAEKHSSGLPHYHALFHDMDPDKPLRKAVLKEQWVHGFSRFKLVESQGAAWYLCKYLSKDLATRVRGSLHYGRPKP